MGRIFQIKRGLKADLPVLEQGEFGLCLDTEELFVGGADKNIKVTPAYTYGTEDLEAGTSELETGALYFVYE